MKSIMRWLSGGAVAVLLSVTMTAQAGLLSSLSPTAGALFDQLGGMSTVNALTSSFLQSSSEDPALKAMFAGADTATLNAQVANQLCANLGGDCKPPLTEKKIKKGAKSLTAAQSSALSANFKTALSGVTQSSLMQQAVNAAVGPEIGGIVAALLSMQAQ
ncbi:MAG TPA: hypothetical protein VIM96_04420 [Pseudomonadales bacterium]|jgi:truncated hemoglobin YjbI